MTEAKLYFHDLDNSPIEANIHIYIPLTQHFCGIIPFFPQSTAYPYTGTPLLHIYIPPRSCSGAEGDNLMWSYGNEIGVHQTPS